MSERIAVLSRRHMRSHTVIKGKVVKWLQKGWDKFIDPEQHKRVDEIAT